MASGPREDYYELLGVPEHVGDDELRRAWRQLAMRWHPDRAGADTTFIFQKLLAAYNVLSDPRQRAAYDKHRGTPPPEPPPPPPVRRRAPGTLIRTLSAPLNALIARRVARRVDDDVIELDVDDETAAEGGMVTISMRVMVRCLACAGGEVGPCHHCDSKREIDDLFAAWLAVPPGVTSGELLRPSALLPGMKPVAFRVRRVAG
jgi:curved DNA-binding protein CbpA